MTAGKSPNELAGQVTSKDPAVGLGAVVALRHLLEDLERLHAPADALASIGIDLERIRQSADAAFGPGALRFPQPPFTPRAKKVLEASLRTAVLFAHYAIEPEHLLLGLIAETEGVAAKVLVELGVNLADTEHALRARIAPPHTRLAELGTRVSRSGSPGCRRTSSSGRGPSCADSRRTPGGRTTRPPRSRGVPSRSWSTSWPRRSTRPERPA